MNQNISNLIRRFAPLIAVIFGIVFIAVGAIGLKQNATFTPTTATIESIEVEYGAGDESDTYKVIVTFTVDGKTYHSDLGHLSNGDYEGKEVNIMYNPEKPEEIITAGKTGPTIAIVLGAVCALAGCVGFVRKLVSGR